MLGKTVATAVGGVGAAFTSALCCAGPLLAVTVGVSGAGLAATFDPLRPYFLIATVGLLGAGFYMLYREDQLACETGKACAEPKVRRWMRSVLWVATGIAVIFGTYPTWSAWVL